MDEPEQLELLNDFDEARVFTLRVNGRITCAFIGRFRRGCDDPLERVSGYYRREEDAVFALDAGTWSPPEPDDL